MWTKNARLSTSDWVVALVMGSILVMLQLYAFHHIGSLGRRMADGKPGLVGVRGEGGPYRGNWDSNLDLFSFFSTGD